MAKKIVYEVDVQTSDAEKGLDKVDKGVKKVGKSTDDLKDKQKDQSKKRKEQIKDEKKEQGQLIDEMGIFGITIGGVKAAFMKMGKTAKLAFSSVRAGMISTGIGALVVAIGALVAYFTQTKRGSDEMRVAMAYLGGIMDAVMDQVIKLGEWLVKLFTDPKQALKDLGNAIIQNIVNRFIGAADIVKGVAKIIQSALKFDWDGIKEGAKQTGDAFVMMTTGIDPEKVREFNKQLLETANAMAALEKRQNALKDSNRELNVAFAQQRADIEALKMIAEDVTKSEEERLQAAQKAFDIENELLDKRVANAEEELRIHQEQMALSENTEADLDREAELLINLANIRQESSAKQLELNNKINGINKEIEAQKEQARAKEEQQEKDRLAAIKAEQDELAKLHRQRATESAERNQQYADLQLSLESALEQELQALEKKRRAASKIVAMQYLYEELSFEEHKIMMDQINAKYDALQEEARIRAANAEIAGEMEKQDALLQMRLANAASILSSIESIGATRMQKEQDQLDKAFKNGEISEEKYNKKKAKLEEDAIKRQKRMAMFQLLIDTASGVSSAIAGAMASATATGPGAVFSAPGFLATMIGLVLSSVAQGYAILSQVPEGGGVQEPSVDETVTSDSGNRPAPTFNADALLGTAQGGGAGEQTPVQAYVVETEISNSQALQDELEFQTTL